MKISDIGTTKSDKIKFLINCAVQSPSSHNTQPWIFRVDGNTIEVWADLSRKLPIGDPTNRELYVSVGASVQNILEGSAAIGVATQAQLFPDEKKSPTLVARLSIDFVRHAKSTINKATINSIWDRRTNRSLYEQNKPIAKKLQTKIIQLAQDHGVTLHLIDDRIKIINIAEMVKLGLLEFLQKKSFRKELSGWIRHDWSKQGDGLPGFSIGMPGIVSVLAPLLVQSRGPINEIAVAEQKAVESCPHVALISIAEDKPLYWVKTGMAFESIALYLHREGVATAILTSAIESPKERAKLKKMIKGNPSLFFRVGYPTGSGISVPRRDGQRVLMTTN